MALRLCRSHSMCRVPRPNRRGGLCRWGRPAPLSTRSSASSHARRRRNWSRRAPPAAMAMGPRLWSSVARERRSAETIPVLADRGRSSRSATARTSSAATATRRNAAKIRGELRLVPLFVAASYQIIRHDWCAGRVVTHDTDTDKEHWSRVASEWIAWARTPHHDAFWAYRDAFAAFVGPGEGTALDVGCGEGRISRELKKLGYRVTAVDPTPQLLDAAAEADSAHDYVMVTATDLPFGDHHFDLVVAYNMLM